MKRIFTLLTSVSLLITLQKSAAQVTCDRPVTGPGVSFTFTGSAQGFTTGSGFNYASNRLNSTDVSAGVLKSLITPTFFLLPGSTTIGWRFDLGGSASVASYLVYAETTTNTLIPICSGLAPASGNGLLFSAPVPAGLNTGENFKLHIDFTIAGNANQNITIDNFGATPAQSAAALPVRFVSLEARKSSVGNVVTWKVHEEDKLREYEIQRSSNGIHFESIGGIPAKNIGQYSFTDDLSSAAKVFYRIKALDIDSRYGYSTVINIAGGKSAVVYKAFPSLVQKNLTIQHNAANTASRITISTEDGRVIRSILPSTGSQQTSVDMSSTKAGLYFVRFEDGNGNVETLKVVKQ